MEKRRLPADVPCMAIPPALLPSSCGRKTMRKKKKEGRQQDCRLSVLTGCRLEGPENSFFPLFRFVCLVPDINVTGQLVCTTACLPQNQGRTLGPLTPLRSRTLRYIYMYAFLSHGETLVTRIPPAEFFSKKPDCGFSALVGGRGTMSLSTV